MSPTRSPNPIRSQADESADSATPHRSPELVGQEALDALRRHGFDDFRRFTTTRNWLVLGKRHRKWYIIKVSANQHHQAREMAALVTPYIRNSPYCIPPVLCVEPNILVFPYLSGSLDFAGGLHPNYVLGGPLSHFDETVANELSGLVRWLHAGPPMPEEHTIFPVERQANPSRLLHGDLRLQNVLSLGGRPFLIDWEHARIGHPLLDYAAILVSMSLPRNTLDQRYTWFLFEALTQASFYQPHLLFLYVRRYLTSLCDHVRISTDAKRLLEEGGAGQDGRRGSVIKHVLSFGTL